MNKITFEDATLVNQAKVSIGGTDYEITPATYSGGTDLNANTFNTMQSNIENAIPEVKTTKTTSDDNVYACNYINDKIESIVLWENSNPTQSMVSNTEINLVSSDYNYYEVLFTPGTYTADYILTSGRIPKGKGTNLNLNIYSGHGMGSYARSISYSSDTKLIVSECWYNAHLSGFGTDNTLMIPYKIIGYK